MQEHNSKPIGKSIKEIRLGISLWFRITRFYNQNIKRTNLRLKDWGLTTAQFDILTQIGYNTRITQQELAEKLVVTKGNITQLLDKMEATDWIVREKDWKTNYLSLTEKGKNLFLDVIPSQEQFQAEQFSNLSNDEQKQLLALLKKLMN